MVSCFGNFVRTSKVALLGAAINLEKISWQLVFINPTSQTETKAMLEGCSTEDTMKEFKYTGGIPRICLGGSKDAKELVDLACDRFATLEKTAIHC